MDQIPVPHSDPPVAFSHLKHRPVELASGVDALYLSGRTVEEARHATPKPVGITNTTEIFRWDRTKWDDGQ